MNMNSTQSESSRQRAATRTQRTGEGHCDWRSRSPPLRACSRRVGRSGSRAQAKRMYDRLDRHAAYAGIARRSRGSAVAATRSPPRCTCWTTTDAHSSAVLQRHAEELRDAVDQPRSDVFVPLNDYTATVIGMVRDDVDFRTRAVRRHRSTSARRSARRTRPPNNAHYEALESKQRRSARRAAVRRRSQRSTACRQMRPPA